MVNRRIVCEKIKVNKDGDPLDKGEIFWHITANNKSLTQRSRNDVIKCKSGEIIPLGNEDLTVSNLDGNDTLTIEGYIADRDKSFSSDEKGTFKQVYGKKDNWGLGSYDISLKDNKFDVVFSYRIEKL